MEVYHVEVESHNVPVRGKAQKVTVRGLGLDLAEPVGAGQQRHQQPRTLAGRQDLGTPQQQDGQRHVGEEVDEVVQLPAIKMRQDLLHAHARASAHRSRRRASRSPSAGRRRETRTDRRGQSARPCLPPRSGPGRRVGVHTPGQKPARCGNAPIAPDPGRLLLEGCHRNLIPLSFLGHTGGQRQVAGDVEHRAAHVANAVDTQDDGDRFARHTNTLQHQHDHRNGPTGHPGRAHAGQHGQQHDSDLLAKRQIHAEHLCEEQDDDTFEQRRAVLIARRPDREHESRDGRRQTEPLFGHPQRYRQRRIRTGRAERREHGRFNVPEKRARIPPPHEDQQERIHDTELDREPQHHRDEKPDQRHEDPATQTAMSWRTPGTPRRSGRVAWPSRSPACTPHTRPRRPDERGGPLAHTGHGGTDHQRKEHDGQDAVALWNCRPSAPTISCSGFSGMMSSSVSLTDLACRDLASVSAAPLGILRRQRVAIRLRQTLARTQYVHQYHADRYGNAGQNQRQQQGLHAHAAQAAQDRPARRPPKPVRKR